MAFKRLKLSFEKLVASGPLLELVVIVLIPFGQTMYFLRCLLVSALLCSAIVSAKSSSIAPRNINNFDDRMELTDQINYRLPNNTKPISYSIDLTTNISQSVFDFTGIVTINIEALEDSKSITLHARQLTIGEIELFNLQDGSTYDLLSHEYDSTTEFLTIRIAGNAIIPKGTKCSLKINYSGVLRTDRKGFYRSSYVDRFGFTR